MITQISTFLQTYWKWILLFGAVSAKVGIVFGLVGSTLEKLGMMAQPKRPKLGAFLIGFGKTLEAWGVDVPKVATNLFNLGLAIARALGFTLPSSLLLLLVLSSLSCASAKPKPCPTLLEAQYTAELVEACGDAGSIEACRGTPAFADVQKRHEAEQEDAGCRK